MIVCLNSSATHIIAITSLKLLKINNHLLLKFYNDDAGLLNTLVEKFLMRRLDMIVSHRTPPIFECLMSHDDVCRRATSK